MGRGYVDAGVYLYIYTYMYICSAYMKTITECIGAS